MARSLFGLAAGLALVGGVFGSQCKTTTLRNSIPANGTNVAVKSFSYCGGTLNITSYIANLNYDKVCPLAPRL